MIGFRCGESYHERGLTARGIVLHEIQVLENDIELYVPLEDLEQIRSRDVAWICDTAKDAERYLGYGDDVYELEYKRKLACDGETPKGYLVEVL